MGSQAETVTLQSVNYNCLPISSHLLTIIVSFIGIFPIAIIIIPNSIWTFNHSADRISVAQRLITILIVVVLIFRRVAPTRNPQAYFIPTLHFEFLAVIAVFPNGWQNPFLPVLLKLPREIFGIHSTCRRIVSTTAIHVKLLSTVGAERPVRIRTAGRRQCGHTLIS